MTILSDQSVQQTNPVVYATFGERIAARLIDGIIVIIPSIFIPFLLPWLYFALQEGSARGATVGKRAMGIRVVSEDGHPIGFGTATGRFLGNFLNLFTLCFGYFVMLFNARNQCLHDMITSTLVIKDSPQIRPQQESNQTQRKRSWAAKGAESETYFVEIDAKGGRFWHRTPSGEEVLNFTLWQLTDDLVNFSAEFGAEKFQEMKAYAEQILRSSV